MHRKKILAICGSTRRQSTNLRLIHAIADLLPDAVELEVYTGIGSLPHFNPDQAEELSRELAPFRSLLKEAAGVIVCTPEYAHGVPGSLKNALDWTVATADFSGKPTMLITASTDGRSGHLALSETLRIIEAKMVDELQLLIPFAGTKISHENIILDAQLLKQIQDLLATFIREL